MGNLFTSTRKTPVKEQFDDGPVLIDIGFVEPSHSEYKDEVQYNLTEFFSEYESMGEEWHGRLDKHVQDLDNKVKIDLNDEKHKAILEGIDCIVQEICEGLCGKGFIINRILKTGSLYAGLRVGRPYEADILIDFEPPSGTEFETNIGYTCTLCNLAPNICVTNWVLHQAKVHGAGVGFKFVYNGGGSCVGTIGVELDLIPFTSKTVVAPILNQTARNYLHSFRDKIQPYSFMSLRYKVKGEETEVDTGYLEHQILCRLDEGTKSGYRVAKYLLQSQLVSQVQHSFSDPSPPQFVGINLTDTQKKTLYGYKPITDSHILQVLLLQLLVKTHGTPLAEKLTGSKLTVCLLDILHKIFLTVTRYHKRYIIVFLFFDPFVEEKMEKRAFQSYCSFDSYLYVECGLQLIGCAFMKHALSGSVEPYGLLSYPNKILDAIYKDCERFYALYGEHGYKVFNAMFKRNCPKVNSLQLTGFCRGASPDEMASAHDCKEETCDQTFELCDIDFKQLIKNQYKGIWKNSHPLQMYSRIVRSRNALETNKSG